MDPENLNGCTHVVTGLKNSKCSAPGSDRVTSLQGCLELKPQADGPGLPSAPKLLKMSRGTDLANFRNRATYSLQNVDFNFGVIRR